MSFDALGSYPLGGFSDTAVHGIGAHYIYVVLPEDRVYLIPIDAEIETILLIPAEDRNFIIPPEVIEERVYIVPAEVRIYEAPHD